MGVCALTIGSIIEDPLDPDRFRGSGRKEEAHSSYVAIHRTACFWSSTQQSLQRACEGACDVRRITLKARITLIAALALAVAAIAGPANAAKTPVDKPIISCAGSTQVSINIMVCAPSRTGATGLPAGFTLQWMTLADYVANGNAWFSSDDPRACDASFSGNASLSRYNLLPGQCVTVNIGEFLFDNGASTHCPGALVCGTTYVFRAFGHATSTLGNSGFTANLSCSTLPCGSNGGCTYTQGYWKTHNDMVCATDPGSPLCVHWPVTSLTLGNVTYTQPQLLSIFETPAAGNGLIALAHQLIAAKLNIANGADGSAVAADIAAADALIGNLVVPPVGSGYLAPGVTSALITSLTNYNEGATGPGHCL
jgi:hypothetical protein